MTLTAFCKYIERLDLCYYEVECENGGTTFYLPSPEKDFMKVARFDKEHKFVSISVEELSEDSILNHLIRDCIEIGNVRFLYTYLGSKRVPIHAVPITGDEEDGL